MPAKAIHRQSTHNKNIRTSDLPTDSCMQSLIELLFFVGVSHDTLPLPGDSRVTVPRLFRPGEWLQKSGQTRRVPTSRSAFYPLRFHQTWLAGKWTMEISDVPSQKPIFPGDFPAMWLMTPEGTCFLRVKLCFCSLKTWQPLWMTIPVVFFHGRCASQSAEGPLGLALLRVVDAFLHGLLQNQRGV